MNKNRVFLSGNIYGTNYYIFYKLAKLLGFKKKVDEEYRTTLINFAKYKIVMFTMARIMEMEKGERNRIVLYLINNVNQKI